MASTEFGQVLGQSSALDKLVLYFRYLLCFKLDRLTHDQGRSRPIITLSLPVKFAARMGEVSELIFSGSVGPSVHPAVLVSHA